MKGGFILVYRNLRDRFFKGDSLGHDLLVYILCHVKWDESTIEFFTPPKTSRAYEVKLGEFICPKKRIADDLGFDSRTIGKTLVRLKTMGFIDTENLYNSTRIRLRSGYMHFIMNPSAFQDESKMNPPCFTNKPITNNKELNRVSNDTLVDEPKKQTDNFDSEGTPNIFEDKKSKSNVTQMRKKAPPVADTTPSNAMTPDKLLKLWNEHSGALPKCRVLSEGRKRKIKLRLKENSDQMYWQKAIQKLSKSDFAMEGRWASFDWLIKNQENPDKAFNGNYDNKTQQTAGYHSSLEGISLTLEDFV